MGDEQAKVPDLPPSRELKRELAGYIWVDSGQLVLTDPDYLAELDAETVDAATDLKQRHAVIMDGLALAFRSGLRSARYPVYVTTFENGAIVKVEIEMTDPSALERG